MVDHLTTQDRSKLMSRIGPKGSKPETTVRRLAHALGFRFRLHRRDLPGTPDLVFPSRRKVIFVHGCWWHRHEGCSKASPPKTNIEFWQAKFDRNVTRDRAVQNQLQDGGWDVGTVWECQTRDIETLTAWLKAFLDPKS